MKNSTQALIWSLIWAVIGILFASLFLFGLSGAAFLTSLICESIEDLNK